MPEGEGEPEIPPAEASYFPRSPDRELSYLKELTRDKDVTILPLREAGFIVHNNKVPLVAEAPWVLMDFDDTAAQTTRGKELFQKKLEEIGFDSEVIQYCDKRSRVSLGDEEPIYEPELEMRLFTVAEGLKKADKISLTQGAKAIIERARKELLEKRDLERFEVSPDILEIYKSTRFSATLYPDTMDTLRKLKSVDPHSPRPANVAIFTYGDPAFQLAKTQQLLGEGIVNDILLTRVRKGEYFKELVNKNPFKELPLQYTYSETQRGVGIQFKDWSIMVELFDDDPSQVSSFNDIAQKLGIEALGIIRVRRQGVKRAEKDIDIRRMVAEIHLGDSYLDTGLYVAAHTELQNRFIEDAILKGAQVEGMPPPYQIRPILEMIAGRRGISLQEEIEVMSKKIGGESFADMFGQPIERPEAYQIVVDRRK